MDDVDSALREVQDPHTSAERLAQLAAMRPDLGSVIALHPHVYDELLDWLAQYGDPAAQAAVARRRAGRDAAASTPDDEAASTSILPPSLLVGSQPEPRRASHRRWVWVGAGAAVLVAVAVVVAVTFAGHPAPVAVVAAHHTAAAAHKPTATPTDAATPTSTPTPTPTASPTPTPAPPQTAVGQATWTFQTESGYGYRMQVSVGAPITAGQNGYRSDGSSDGASDSTGSDSSGGDGTDVGDGATIANTIGSVCEDFDPATDAAVPVTMTVTATTTNGFTTPVSANFSITEADSVGDNDEQPDILSTMTLESEEFFSDNTDCASSSDMESMGVEWDDKMAEGDVGTAYFDVIIKNYFSPSYPHGAAGVLPWIDITPGQVDTQSTAVGTYNEQTGPASLALNGSVVQQQDGD